MELSSEWTNIVSELITDSMLGSSNAAFLRQTRLLGYIGDTVLVEVPTTYAKDVIEKNLQNLILEHLNKITERQLRLAVSVNASLEEIFDTDNNVAEVVVANFPTILEEKSNETTSNGLASASLSEENLEDFYNKPLSKSEAIEYVKAVEARRENLLLDADWKEPNRSYHQDTDGSINNVLHPAPNQVDTHLNSKFTFDTFVMGDSNRFAHAASIAVAEHPAHNYNPLFIWGGSGLGKTHLLHAIGHYAMSLYPGITVRYVNSEEFTNDFINSISSGRAESFQGRYRNVDILLIDDIQFLQGKEQTIEEFFHTFNALHNQEKQIVITSDVPPKQLNGFEERMKSRFSSGLLTDVQPPNLETRIAILQKKAVAENVRASDEVLTYIASRFSTNIRELEGALLRVTAFASLNKQPISLALAEMVLKDIISNPLDAEITTSLIKAQIAGYFHISVEQLCSTDRSRSLTEARQIAMYLCRELTDLSLPKIGQEFSRDHTTVMHANKKILEAMKSNPTTFNHVNELTNRIKQAARKMMS